MPQPIRCSTANCDCSLPAYQRFFEIAQSIQSIISPPPTTSASDALSTQCVVSGIFSHSIQLTDVWAVRVMAEVCCTVAMCWDFVFVCL